MYRFTSSLAAVTAAVALVGPGRAAEPGPNLDGTWLFAAARVGKSDDLGRVWESVVTVKDGAFRLTKLMGHKKDLTGKLAFDPADPAALDLVLDELDFTDLGAPMKIPAGTYRGTFKRDGPDRVTVCFANEIGAARPKGFDPSMTQFVVTLARAPAGFTDYPKEVTLTVTDADGKPVAGAAAARFMSRREVPGKPTEWTLYKPATTGPDGTVKVPFADPPLIVRDEAGGRIAFPAASPAGLAGGAFRVTLAPACRVTGTLASAELAKAGRPLGWTNVYLMQNGRRFADCSSSDGTFEFPVPPGDYTLNAYGENVHGKDVPLSVPADRSEFAAAPVDLKATRLALLTGKPAPELEGVVGWSGKPVKFADLRGQYVLVDFWGYWCGPCVGAMPVLIELHEKFGGKGLAVVGVHVDPGGEVDTAEKLAPKVAGYVKGIWNGKELPFPSALASGKRVREDGGRGGPAEQYGITSYPTTILIDPEGKVVGKFHARDVKHATAEVEKLLAGKK